jgi:hypothetical protein
MRKINRLIREAKLSCELRDHKMSRFSHGSVASFNEHASSTCNICGAYVAVCTAPYPNQVEIAGTAVALNCPVEQK